MTRIIPARAGFTCATQAIAATARDHPRSRGVYPPTTSSPRSPPGSSPLARGLHVPDEGVASGVGIIPARAGFTLLRPGRRPGRPDHPRSRGVYRDRRVTMPAYEGSSPLARGLHATRFHTVGVAGIIPARAGFTIRSSSSPRTPWDHPRSRGVYSPRPRRQTASLGSSPLARGLLTAAGYMKADPRIIPARAGFTHYRSASSRRGWDHPRSRGVYRSRRYGVRHKLGSSPLARGLLVPGARHHIPNRIIPARAGFTPQCPKDEESP